MQPWSQSNSAARRLEEDALRVVMLSQLRSGGQQSLFSGTDVQEPQADLWESRRQAVRERAPALEQLARAIVRQYESWRLSRVTALPAAQPAGGAPIAEQADAEIEGATRAVPSNVFAELEQLVDRYRDDEPNNPPSSQGPGLAAFPEILDSLPRPPEEEDARGGE